MKNTGFTLIEVMISLFILVIIGTTTAKAVVDAAKLKEVLKDETEFSSEYRTSMAFIERDLSMVYNPRWLLSPDLRPLDPNNLNANIPSTTATVGIRRPPPVSIDMLQQRLHGTAFQTFEYWGMVLDGTGIRSSRFKGDDQSMSFVTDSHVRIYAQKKESIFAKVKYELIPQPPNPNLNDEQNAALKGLFALVKIENTHAFELEEPKDVPYVNQYVVLNNIKKLKLGYYKEGKKDPVHTWDSENIDARGIFPESVEMELQLREPNGNIMDSKISFKLETPNDVLPKTY